MTRALFQKQQPWLRSLSWAAYCTAGLLSLRAAEDPAVFHVNTQLVEVDVVARGKHGPVATLTKDDFTILDNGKPQKLAVFSVRAASGGRASEATFSLPPGVVSNRLTQSGEEPSSPTVILWDALNTETSDQAWVRNEVVKYLLTVRPRDPVAVYILVRNLRVIQDFTADPLPLIQALRRTNAEQSADLSAPDLTDLQGQIAAAFQAPPGAPAVMAAAAQAMADLQTMAVTTATEMTDYSLRDQVYITQAALESIAEHLSGLPGRKKLVWISGSFPAITNDQRTRNGAPLIEVRDYSPQIYHAIRALNGANVAVYPIDPRGVTATALTAPGLDTMNLLAGGTGGQAFYATNDAAGAIKTIMEDGEVTYRLGFYPTDVRMDGTYHELSIKVARKGTQIAEVGARKGYFALDAKNSSNGHWRDRLTESMQNPLEATQLGLRAAASPVKGAKGMYDLVLTLDLEGLHFERVPGLEHAQAGRWTAALAFGTQFSPSDSTKGTLETIRLNLTEDKLRAALKNGYVLRRKIAVGDRTGKLRVAIEDPATGMIGSVSIPFGELVKASDPAKAAPGP